MDDLPEDQVTFKGVFYNTGIDYCGFFFVKKKKILQ